MGSVETETRDERICRVAHNLAVLVKEQKVKMQESKQLCLGAIEVLLAHPDFFCQDFVEQLEQEKATHLGLPEDETSDEPELQDSEVAEPAKDAEYMASVEREKAAIWNRLDNWNPNLQRDVLEALLAEFPEKEREYNEETAASEACDDFIDFVHQGLPATEQTKVYQNLLEQAKNNGLVSLKKSA